MTTSLISNNADFLPIFQKAFQCYRTLTSIDISEYEKGDAQLVFPVLPVPMFTKLCVTASQIFRKEPVVLNLPINDNSDDTEKNPNAIIVIGDIHGHILDLLRILRKFGYPPKQSYLFLGDIVDRGSFSTETAILILLLKVLWPKYIYVIRGNHEFSEMWDKSGFQQEIFSTYNSINANSKIQSNPQSVVEGFSRAFSNIPIAAVLYDNYLCVHGGVGPNFTSLDELKLIERPIDVYDSEPLGAILWSDPSEDIQTFLPSIRGIGYFYGAEGLREFLTSQNLSLLIRGHQCIDFGVQFALENQVVTVFSASSYCGTKQNQSGVLIVRGKTEYEVVTFPPLRYIERSEASFLISSSETTLVFNSRAVKLNLQPPYSKTKQAAQTSGIGQSNSSPTIPIPPHIPKSASTKNKPKILPQLPNAKPYHCSGSSLNTLPPSHQEKLMPMTQSNSFTPMKPSLSIPNTSPRQTRDRLQSKGLRNGIKEQNFSKTYGSRLNSSPLASNSSDSFERIDLSEKTLVSSSPLLIPKPGSSFNNSPLSPSILFPGKSNDFPSPPPVQRPSSSKRISLNSSSAISKSASTFTKVLPNQAKHPNPRKNKANRMSQD